MARQPITKYIELRMSPCTYILVVLADVQVQMYTYTREHLMKYTNTLNVLLYSGVRLYCYDALPIVSVLQTIYYSQQRDLLQPLPN